MTPKQAAMVAFLRARYDESLRLAQSIQDVVSTEGLPNLGIRPDQTAGLSRVHAAESRIRFLDATVVPYLGLMGETGRIANEQLWLLVDEHRGDPGYEEAWRLRPLP